MVFNVAYFNCQFIPIGELLTKWITFFILPFLPPLFFYKFFVFHFSSCKIFMIEGIDLPMD